MNIFGPDYLYKIRLIGYTVKTIENNCALTHIYFKSHDILYEIEYNQNLDILNISSSPNLDDIENCDIISEYKGNFINVKHCTLKELKEFNFERLVMNVVEYMFADSIKVIACPAFILDFNVNKMLVVPGEFGYINTKEFLKKLTTKGEDIC